MLSTYARIKRRTWLILEVADTDDTASRAFDFFIMALILANILAVILETVESLREDYGPFFMAFEAFSVAVFLAEYLLRVWSCTSSTRFPGSLTGRTRFAVTPLAIVDLLAILPALLPLFGTMDARMLRALRLLRIFRLLKLGRYAETSSLFAKTLKSKREELTITLAVLSVLLVIASSLMYQAEHQAQPEAFPDIPSAMWWGIITLTTVGYGDISPVTPMGKLIGGFIAVLGVGLFALPAGILASGFSEAIKAAKGQARRCPSCGCPLPDDD
ncbi:MAG: ion transporter [Sumerlaeia bacterium]